MKTTQETLNIALGYFAARVSAARVADLVNSTGLTDLQKLKHAYDYVTHQKRQPAALVVWLQEAIEREENGAS